MRVQRSKTFWQQHSLTIISSAILLAWVLLYRVSDEHKHWGAFFGNAIADWTGLVVTVVATKYFYEIGSAESRQPKSLLKGPLNFLRRHSLTIFLLITGGAWLAIYIHSPSEGKWGQVVGNIVSEWTQLLGLLLLTKKFIEKGSKESN